MCQNLLSPARHQPHLLIPSTNTINHKKPKKQEMIFHSQKIEPYYLGLHTQLPGLRELDLERNTKIGSDKINMLK